MSAVAEVLRSARAKIERPENWTQGTYCRDAQGEAESLDCDAVSYCAEGALMSFVDGDCFHAAHAALSREMGRGIVGFNDNHTHDEVLAAFDRAIALAEATP